MVANDGKDVFLVMPDPKSMIGWITVLQVRGDRLNPGESRLCTSGRAIGVLGTDWKIAEDLEVRLMASGGKITTLVQSRTCK